MKHFFIVGLPRSRTAWLANFLTNGDAFCFHELSRQCSSLEELKQKLEAAAVDRGPTAIVGNADPGLVNWLPALIKEFPEAKVVWLSRDPNEAYESHQKAFPTVAQNAETWDFNFKKLLAALAPIEGEPRFRGMPYEDLESPDECEKLHFFCLGRLMDVERWKLLNGLRVTAIAEKARTSLAPWAKLQLIQQSDPQNPASKLWEEITREICGDNKHAFKWLCDLKLIALTWDHIVDHDMVNTLEADLCFEAMLLKWPLNPFWTTHQAFLAPVLANAVSSWRHGSRIQHFECYTHPALAVAYLLGGPEHQARFAQRVHELARMGCSENDAKSTVHSPQSTIREGQYVGNGRGPTPWEEAGEELAGKVRGDYRTATGGSY